MTVTTPLSTERPRLVDDQDGHYRVAFPLGELPRPAEKQGAAAWYVPYTKVHPQTVAAAPVDARWVDVSASPDAYYWALREIWAKAETFALLEHDVVCRPDVIRAFEECPEPWCSYPYADICHPGCQEAWANQLGCVRFRAELIEAVPEAMWFPRDNWDWHNMCDGLGENLRAAGYSHHWHALAVEHFHHGQVVACD